MFILNISVDLLLRVSQPFKYVLLVMAENTSDLTTELNFW